MEKQSGDSCNSSENGSDTELRPEEESDRRRTRTRETRVRKNKETAGEQEPERHG
jgi:hypothetical protein